MQEVGIMNLERSHFWFDDIGGVKASFSSCKHLQIKLLIFFKVFLPKHFAIKGKGFYICTRFARDRRKVMIGAGRIDKEYKVHIHIGNTTA